MNFMGIKFEYISEQALPKVSETSLFKKQYEQPSVRANVIAALKDSAHFVKKETLTEILSLMKLNGDSLAKKVVASYEKGDIIIHFNKEFQTNIKSVPSTIPYLVTKMGSDQKVVIFASSFMKNITSSSEYRNLLTVMEAGYLALCLVKNPNKFTMNRSLMQKMCLAYTIMTTSPMEQRLYMKGENLTKAMMYTIAYFYRSIDGADSLSAASLPVKSIIADKIDQSLLKSVVEEVKAMPDNNFMTYLELIKKINPIRYKDLTTQYLSMFNSCCGLSIMFALENLQYLFLVITSANYKSSLTQFGLNRTVKDASKSIQVLLNQTIG
jgi:hypothetical protein